MKTKKVLSSLLLAFILLLSSLLLFACGKNETSQSTFKEFTSFITEIESEKSVLVNSKIAQGETDFAFKDFSQKDEFAQKDSTIYDHYSILVGVGIDFIQEYHTALDGAQLKTDYSGLRGEIQSLKKNYDMLKTEYENMIEADSLNYVIYNGHFARYRVQAQKFVNQTYQCAIALGEFLTEKFEFAKNFGQETMTEADIEFYLDLSLLKIFDSYREFFIDSSKGAYINNSLFTNTLKVLDEKLFSKFDKDYAEISADKAKEIKEMFEIVHNEGKIASKALSKFSVYNFANTYGGSIDAYKKSNKDASAYLSSIQKYMTYLTYSNCTVENLLENLNSFII